MAYYYTIKVVRNTRKGVKTVCLGKDVYAGSVTTCAGVAALVVRAFKMPATIRVEVDERDTQLYAYPEEERIYQKHVLLKNGQMWKFYGKGSEKAVLVEDFDMWKHSHTYQI